MAIDRPAPPPHLDRATHPSRKILRSVLLAAIPSVITTNLIWFGLYTFVNGYLIRDLHKSNEQWTAATLFFTGGMLAMPSVIIEISSRIGRRRAVVLGMLLGAIFYALLGFTTSFPVILGLMAMASFGPVTSDVALFPLIGDVCGEYAGKAFASVMFLSVVVASICLLAGGFLIEALNFRQSFYVFAGVCAICAWAFAHFSRGMHERRETKVARLTQLSRADVSALLHGPFLAILLFGVFSAPFYWHTANQLYPNLGRDVFRLPEHFIGVIVALGRLPAMLVLLILARRIDRLNALTILGLGIGLSGLFIGAIGLSRELWMYLALYAMYFTAHAMNWGSMSAGINSNVPSRLRDTAFALMSMVSTSAAVLVGFIHNRLLAHGIGLGSVFVVCGSVGFFSGTVLTVYSRVHKSRTVGETIVDG
jgi:MFS family permease